MSILLLLLVLLPLAGAAVAAALPSGRAAMYWALGVSVATAACAVPLLWKFDFKQDLSRRQPPTRAYRVVQVEYPPPPGAEGDVPAMRFGIREPGFEVEFRLGADTISLFLVLLTVVLAPLAIAASFQGITARQKEYYAWMLVLLSAMNGVFLARDLLLFYIFFELTLIPMFFIIGIWGGPERRYAAGKFFLFTFGGSIFTLAAVIYLGTKYGTYDIIKLTALAQNGFGRMPALTSNERFWILLGLCAGFAVKVPLFPLHTWLPLAHTEAPTAGSVILAGVLLKLGTYGLLRLAIPLGIIGIGLNEPLVEGYLIPAWEFWHYRIAMIDVLRFLAALSIIGIIYGALVAWVQQDVKKLVAYSSVSHLGFCVLGLVALNDIGMQGSVLYMINHGINTGALFLVVGMIYDRYHTRDINELSGLARVMPRLAFFFILFTLASVALPGLNGFVSEFLTLLGAFVSPHLGIGYAALAALGVILGAVYMLHMAARVIWGPLRTPPVDHGELEHHAQEDQGQAAAPGHALPTDIGGREMAVLVPLAVLVVVLGVMPNLVLKPIKQPIDLLRAPVAANPRRPLPPSPPPEQATLLTPSPGTPGEGRGEGFSAHNLTMQQNPHPNPLPEYREREQEQASTRD